MIDVLKMEPEEFLQALLTGDLSPDARAVRTRLESDAELAARWSELQATQADVVDVLAEVRETLTASGDVAERRIDFAAAMEGSSPSGHRLNAVVMLAAAVLVAGLAWAFYGPFGAAPDPELGPGQAVLTPDQEGSRDYAMFSWETKRMDVDYYVVEVSDAETGTFVTTSKRTHDTAWQPDDERRNWPDRIRWTLTARDAFDRDLFVVAAVTWRQ